MHIVFYIINNNDKTFLSIYYSVVNLKTSFVGQKSGSNKSGRQLFKINQRELLMYLYTLYYLRITSGNGRGYGYNRTLLINSNKCLDLIE